MEPVFSNHFRRVKRRSRLSPDVSGESGQSIIEFALMLLVAVGMVTMMNAAFKGTIKKMWFGLAKEIAAACPNGCPPPPGM